MNSISVIIPVRNGEDTLQKCLQSIREQTIGSLVEILILDTNSTDNSRAIAESFGAKIFHIEPSSFSHGGTRNLGAEMASGELLYYTVQDARISSKDMLEKMASYFQDKDVQGVNGIQGVPSELDKNPAVWFKRFSKPIPEVRWFKNDTFSKLTSQQQLENCRWDNVNAMYRKDAIVCIPFKTVNFAEDAVWALEALTKGYKLIRDSSLLTYHYHYHDFSYTFRVVYIVHYGIMVYFKTLPKFPNFIKSIALNTYSILKKKEIGFAKKVYWIWHNIARNVAHFLSIATLRFLNLFGTKAVEKGLVFFCSQIPQGKQVKAIVTLQTANN